MNIIDNPGINIASVFIVAIVFSSLFSRVWRSTICVVERVDSTTLRGSSFVSGARNIRIVYKQNRYWDESEYRLKEAEKRTDNHIPPDEPILFFEVTPGDASEFSGVLKITGEKVNGFRVLRTHSAAVPNAIAAFLLFLRNETGKLPHVYFGWSEGNPLSYLMKYIAFGEGDTAPVTQKCCVSREGSEQRPIVHVGG